MAVLRESLVVSAEINPDVFIDKIFAISQSQSLIGLLGPYVVGFDIEPKADDVWGGSGQGSDMGVKGAVAVLFDRRFIKSKKAATSNWANPHLTPAQLVYAANDAWAAIRVYDGLGLA